MLNSYWIFFRFLLLVRINEIENTPFTVNHIEFDNEMLFIETDEVFWINKKQVSRFLISPVGLKKFFADPERMKDVNERKNKIRTMIQKVPFTELEISINPSFEGKSQLKKMNLEKIISRNNFLNQKKPSTVKTAQKNALIKAFKKNKIPFREFKIKEINEEVLGQLFAYFILETVIIGKLIKINPFDQPAVEQVKVYTNKLLSWINQI